MRLRLTLAGDDWEKQHEARAKVLEGELEKLKLHEPAASPIKPPTRRSCPLPAQRLPAALGAGAVPDQRELETEESFFSFTTEDFPGKEQLDALDEEETTNGVPSHPSSLSLFSPSMPPPS